MADSQNEFLRSELENCPRKGYKKQKQLVLSLIMTCSLSKERRLVRIKFSVFIISITCNIDLVERLKSAIVTEQLFASRSPQYMSKIVSLPLHQKAFFFFFFFGVSNILSARGHPFVNLS